MVPLLRVGGVYTLVLPSCQPPGAVSVDALLLLMGMGTTQVIVAWNCELDLHPVIDQESFLIYPEVKFV